MDGKTSKEVEEARNAILEMFQSVDGPKQVALRHKNRIDADEWKENPFNPTFHSLYQSDEFSMTFLRPVTNRYGPALSDSTIASPAGLPKYEECKEASLYKVDFQY